MSNKHWNFLVWSLCGLSTVSAIRIIASFLYCLNSAKGEYNYAMSLMDKAHTIHIPSLITGISWGGVAVVMVMIILDK